MAVWCVECILFGKEVSRDRIKVTALINIRYVAHRVTELMRMRWAGHVAHMGVNAYRDLADRPAVIYRVSIKSFPDYRHLLQENYCTWNTNIYIYIFFFF